MSLIPRIIQAHVRYVETEIWRETENREALQNNEETYKGLQAMLGVLGVHGGCHGGKQ